MEVFLGFLIFVYLYIIAVGIVNSEFKDFMKTFIKKNNDKLDNIVFIISIIPFLNLTTVLIYYCIIFCGVILLIVLMPLIFVIDKMEEYKKEKRKRLEKEPIHIKRKRKIKLLKNI